MHNLEQTFMRLEVGDAIHVVITETKSGRLIEDRKAIVFGFNAQTDNIRRACGTMEVTLKASPPDHFEDETLELETEPVRGYLDLYSRRYIYFPIAATQSRDGIQTIQVRRRDKTASTSS